MRLVVTGGGTGGHIFPALEVARHCAESGASIHYLGSHRGQEGAICRAQGVEFSGFGSEPLWSLSSPRGWRALWRLWRASQAAASSLRVIRPDVVFSTGGYSAAPVMRAAVSANIPLVIHEQNSVPGRSNRMFAKRARSVATTFEASQRYFEGIQVVRTGLPIRKPLREAAQGLPNERKSVLLLGGSQGSRFLNNLGPRAAAAAKGEDLRWIHSTGPAHITDVKQLCSLLALSERYRSEPFLNVEQVASAYRHAGVAIGRSGGTLAEYALFRIPSVLIPLPSAAGNHQFHNANEFCEMKAATVLNEQEATPEQVAREVTGWLSDDARRSQAASALASWDVPDSTERIASMLSEALR